MKTLTFTVSGLAKPAGSKRGFALRKGGILTGRVAITDACKTTKSWQAQIKVEAAAAVRRGGMTELLSGPLRLSLNFILPRPKSHYTTKCLRTSAPGWHTKKPDLLKLARAVEDALTGIVYVDDSQICVESLRKTYGALPGCIITISEEL